MPQESIILQLVHYRCFYYYMAISMHAPSVSPLTPTIDQLLLASYTLLELSLSLIDNHIYTYSYKCTIYVLLRYALLWAIIAIIINS